MLFFAHPVFPDAAISSPCFFSIGKSVDEGIKKQSGLKEDKKSVRYCKLHILLRINNDLSLEEASFKYVFFLLLTPNIKDNK